MQDYRNVTTIQDVKCEMILLTKKTKWKQPKQKPNTQYIKHVRTVMENQDCQYSRNQINSSLTSMCQCSIEQQTQQKRTLVHSIFLPDKVLSDKGVKFRQVSPYQVNLELNINNGLDKSIKLTKVSRFFMIQSFRFHNLSIYSHFRAKCFSNRRIHHVIPS